MNNNGEKSNQNLLKMKVALAAGGLMATLIGAGLLGNQAETTAVDTTTATTANTTTTINESTSSTAITLPELDLDLNLEAIPTVAAPTSSTNSTNTFSSRPIANGRSSG